MEDIKMSNAMNQLNYSNDLFFKYTLSREDEGSVYARNTIIERVTGIKVKESTVLNPNLDPGIIGKKRIILDVHVKDEQNRHFNIEMQTTCRGIAEMMRFEFYGARALNNQLKSGEFYDQLKPVYQIIFIDEYAWNNRNLINQYQMRNEQGENESYYPLILRTYIHMPAINDIVKEKELQRLNDFEQLVYLFENNEKNDIGTKFENQNYMDNALKHIASMDTLILRATIVNKYGNIYCTDTSIPEEYVKTIRNMTKEWMLFEGKEDEYYYGDLQGDNANILTFLYPLHTYGNTPIALLAVDINYKTFQSILENAFYENSGECFILTGEQELFHIGEDLYQKEEKGYIFDKSQKMMKENLIVDTFQSKGKNFYISSRQNMLSGWKIIQVIPEERLFEEVDQKIKWNSIFLLGALMLVVSFSIYYTKKIIEPLEEFCKKISHTKGDQLQIINLEHMKLTREIANVIENYNEMANKMNEYLVREIIYDKNQRKIQSKMLRYQINPHFLYNTLNLIASMGELSDFPEIVEITKNLSCIMQYNVKGSRFVSLKTEVEMVKAYLEIQRIRFHDCFSVEYEIERQIEQVRIVKFILQPIVENIFEHGFTMDENDNKIWIKAFKCENDIVILVKDNGCGIDSEKREELNRILCERTRRISYIDEEEKSIGINNVNTRIKNYYGEKYGVKVNKADKGTEIQLLLGIENLEEENKDK